jgi:GAF domain-containing protein
MGRTALFVNPGGVHAGLGIGERVPMGTTVAPSGSGESDASVGKVPGTLDPVRLRQSLAVLVDGDLMHSTTRRKLLRVVTLAAETFPGCYAAATAKDHDGEVCTNSAAYHLDQAQFRSGSGPCAEAMASLRAVRVDVIEQCPWRDFRRAAAENRIGSSLSIPLLCSGAAIGVLNLYSRETNGFVGCEAGARAFAQAAAILLAGAP